MMPKDDGQSFVVIVCDDPVEQWHSTREHGLVGGSYNARPNFFFPVSICL